ncbi:beta strand repeat-containing protein [Granulicella sibirica]|nr:choice-of-anchor D domain-containing protein [Granulicella sibirica]
MPGAVLAPRITGLGAAWTSAGPNQVATTAFGNVTGRVTAIAVDPADVTGNTVYLGSSGGGVWKSINAAGPVGNVKFLPLTDVLPVFAANLRSFVTPSLSIGALTVQPGVGLGAAILAGTGDPNDATDSYYGSGILRSVDGGSTWTIAVGGSDGFAGSHSFTGLGAAGFAWSTATSGLVVAAMSQSREGLLENDPASNSVLGLYYSTDAGATWELSTVMDGSQIVQSPLVLGDDGNGSAATSVVWNPIRQEFLAAIRYHGYYSSPDGATWTRLDRQPGSGLTSVACPAQHLGPGSSDCPIFRGSLAVQPVTGDTFALTVDSNNLDQGLWQDVCGASGPGCASQQITFGTQIASTPLERGSGSTEIPQADYDLALTAVPVASGDTVNTLLFVGTEDLYRCTLTNGQGATCLLRNTTNAMNGCLAPAKVASAQHAIAIAELAEPLVYLGNDGGLWRSVDGVAQTGLACSADDATHFDNLNGSLGSLAESVSLASSPTDGNTLLLGVGANGTALTSNASALEPWVQLATGEGGTVAIDQTNPLNLFISTGSGVSISSCDKGPGCGPNDFAGLPTIGSAQVSGDAALVDAPFLLDPVLASNIITGTCRVWRGPSSGGSAWSGSNALSAFFSGSPSAACVSGTNPLVRSLGAGGPPSSTAASQNAGATVLYAGLAGTLDGGGSIGGHLLTVSSADTAGPATVWHDAAGTNVSNDIADGGKFNPGGFDLSSIAVDAHDATGRTVYVTLMGFAGRGVNAPHLYRSLDGGGSWANLSSNLPNAPANSVVIDPNDANTVYVAMDTGVYVTTQVAMCSSANCWSLYGTALPNAPVVQLVASAGVATSDGRTGELLAATYGRGVWRIPLLTAVSPAVPAITLSPTTLSFGDTAVATESASQTVTVTNSGNASLTVTGVTASGDFVETDNCIGPGVTIAVGATCTVSVSFLPASSGVRSGLLTVYGNVPLGQAIVSLAGTGTSAAAIVLNPIAVTFPTTNVGSTSAPINITISNTGESSVTLQTPAVSGDFAPSANTCGESLASQTGCTVSVVFHPTLSGVRTGRFSITDSVGTQVASLSGSAQTLATDDLSPLMLSFGAQVLNTTSVSQTVTLTNSGDTPLTLIAANRTTGDFTVVNGCGNSLNGHSACAISLAYVPKTVGPETGSLTVSDQLRSQMVMLTGTGLAPAGVSLSPFAGIAFGATAVGVTSSAQTVTLTNNGGVALNLQSASISGDFVILGGSNGCGNTLAVATSCTLQVAFVPTVGGTRTGSLAFTDSAANSPQTLTLSGTAIDFTLTPDGPTSVSVSNGVAGKFPLLLTSATGTPGTASFACAGAPANATCNVTPQDPALGGTTVISVTLATGVSASGAAARRNRFATTIWLEAVLPLWIFAFRRNNRPGRSWRGFILCLLCAGLIGFAGCGADRLIPETGAGTSSPGGVVTPSGSYSVAVSAMSAGLTRTVNLTLIVQ